MSKFSSLKIIIAFVAILIVVGAGYVEWKIRKSDEGKTKQNDFVNRQETQTKPVPTQKSEIPRIDTSDWKTYRNEKYGFEVKYPSTYTLRNWDKYPIAQSRSILIRGDKNTDTTIEIVTPQEEKNMPLLGYSGTPYVSYIQDQNRYTKKETISIGDRIAYIFFFKEENPGAVGDWRDTIVVLIKLDGNYLIIKRSPASYVDGEFEKILSTLRFFHPERGDQ